MRSRPAFVALLTSAVLAGVLLFARLPNDAVQNGVDQAVAQEKTTQPETPAKKKQAQNKNAQKKAAAQAKDDHPVAPGEVAEPR